MSKDRPLLYHQLHSQRRGPLQVTQLNLMLHIIISISTYFIHVVRRPVLVVKKAHVTMLLSTPFVSKETPILSVEVVRRTVSALVTQPNVHPPLKRRMVHRVMKTRTHVSMEHAQVSQDNSIISKSNWNLA